MKDFVHDIIVAGGGAGGFFAAITALEQYPGRRVLLLEKSAKVLAKVSVSGGGRCNVTNTCSDPEELIAYYPRGGKNLLSIFYHFGQKETVDWFTRHGVELHTEADGRMFPVSNRSQTIIDCLTETFNSRGGELQLHKDLIHFEKTDDLFELHTRDGSRYKTRKLIIATGGAPKKEMLSWLSEHGHEIIEPVPSLFTFNLPKEPICTLMGLSVEQAQVKIRDTRFSFAGPLLITHWGFSGPAVLKLSAYGARWIAEQGYRFSIEISWLHPQKKHIFLENFVQQLRNSKDKKLRNNRPPEIPGRLWEYLLLRAGSHPDKNSAEVSGKETGLICDVLFGDVYDINGKTTFKEEFVTAGGIALKQVNMRTMESKIIPGLYFSGEILDIDGITGGFNFQAAWSTAYVAALSALKELKN